MNGEQNKNLGRDKEQVYNAKPPKKTNNGGNNPRNPDTKPVKNNVEANPKPKPKPKSNPNQQNPRNNPPRNTGQRKGVQEGQQRQPNGKNGQQQRQVQNHKTDQTQKNNGNNRPKSNAAAGGNIKNKHGNEIRSWYDFPDSEVAKIQALPERRVRQGSELVRAKFDKDTNTVYFADGTRAIIKGVTPPKPAVQEQEVKQSQNDANSNKENEKTSAEIAKKSKAKEKEERKREKALKQQTLVEQKKTLMLNQPIQQKPSMGKRIGKLFMVLLASATMFAIGFTVAIFTQEDLLMNDDIVAEDTTKADDETTQEETEIVGDKIEVVQLVSDVIQGEIITEDMLQSTSISMEVYNQIALNGTNIYLWDRVSNLIGMYATDYIPKGQYLTHNSVSATYEPPHNIYQFASGSGVTYYDVPVANLEYDDSIFIPGAKFKVTIQKKTVIETPTTTDNSEGASTTVEQSIRIDEYILPSKTVVDVITKDEGSLYRTLYALLSVPAGEQSPYLESVVDREGFVDSVTPQYIRVGLSPSEAKNLEGIKGDDEDVVVIIESLDEADKTTTEKAEFFSSASALAEKIHTIIKNMDTIADDSSTTSED